MTVIQPHFETILIQHYRFIKLSDQTGLPQCLVLGPVS